MFQKYIAFYMIKIDSSSCFLRQACITINSLLKTAFALSHRFWKVLFLFFFSLKVYFGIISDIFFGPLVF